MRKSSIFKSLLFVTLVCLSIWVNAQQSQITGAVTGTGGETLSGVTVTIKGTSRATRTNDNGQYSILASRGETLVFTNVGYIEENIPVGANSVINATLRMSDKNMDEVVVTALGIKKNLRSLGYSQAEVKGEDLANTQRENFLSALAGRVPGVSITITNGLPGSSTAIQLRGVNSLSGSNEPLFVIDGLPVSNNTFRGNDMVTPTENRTVDFSNRIADINPDDIESMSILKGPEAAALYGIEAANGAVVITTKKGKAGKGSVSYSYNLKIQKPGDLPKYDQVYMRGRNGLPSVDDDFLYFGPRYPDSVKKYDNVNQFFQTGVGQHHNLSIDGGFAKNATYRFSSSYSSTKGIVPTTKYDRLNLTLATNATLLEKINLETTLQYMNTDNQKVSKGAGSFYLSMLAWPIDEDITQYLNPDGSRKRITGVASEPENPFFDVYKNNLFDKGDRMITNIGLNSQITKWLRWDFRGGGDISSQQSQILYHPESNRADGNVRGRINIARQSTKVITFQTFATIKKSFLNERFSTTLRLGASTYDLNDNVLATYGEKFYEPDFRAINNTDPLTHRSKSTLRRKRVGSVFGSLDLGYKSFLYATITGRNDWSSTLPLENRSFFYPSASLAFVASDLYKGSSFSEIVNYAKLRFSVAQVGKDARPYSLYPALELQTTTGGGFGYGFTAPNPYLRPEMVTSTEVGGEFKFLKDKIGFDIAYYKSKSVDQIINGLRISYGTGFILKNVNGGELENSGIEMVLTAKPITTQNFKWDFSVTFDRKFSKLIKLGENIPEFYDSDTWLVGNVRNGSRVGGGLYTMTGRYTYEYNKNGDLLIDPTTGRPILKDNPLWVVIADRNPDFMMGFRNSLSYKNISLNFLWDIRKGGDVYNGTSQYLYNKGLHERTIEFRETPITFTGVLKDGLQDTDNPTQNNITITPYYNDAFFITNIPDQDFIERDVNWLRLRDVTLNYALPKSVLGKTRVIKGASVAFTATDLFMFTNYTGADPGTNGTNTATGGSGGSGFDYGNMPLPKSYNFTFRINL